MTKLFFGALVIVIACTSKKPDSSAVGDTTVASSTTTVSGETPIKPGENAVAPEVNPPGDIPDTQGFVKYASSAGGYQLDVPEGWARTENGPSVSFVDKLDGVKVDGGTGPASATLNPASVRASEAKTIQSQGRAVTINSVADVKLPGGNAVVIKYTSNSDPNSVTNRQVRLENETYVFRKNGKEMMLTMWAPKGADNVDQWQRMAKSFQWR